MAERGHLFAFIPRAIIREFHDARSPPVHLEPDDQKRFYHVFRSLLHFVNTLRRIDPAASYDEIAALPPSKAIRVRDALWAEPALLDRMVAENPFGLTASELGLVGSWKAFVRGNFIVERVLKEHVIMMAEGRVYAAIGIVSSIEDCLPPQLPCYIEAALLPYGDRIIYDGLIRLHPVKFGGGTRARVRDDYMRAKKGGTIIARLGLATSRAPEPAS